MRTRPARLYTPLTASLKPLHPFCNDCGWRKGGIDSWNGRACKCGLREPPMQLDATLDPPKIVSTKQRRAEKKERAVEEREQLFRDCSTLVKVLEQHKQTFVDRAGELAKERFQHWMTLMRNAGWDINETAPAPGKDADAMTAVLMRERRQHFFDITERATVPATADNSIRVPSLKKKAAYVKQMRYDAKQEYMCWIFKMITKIGGHVTSATMTGDPWTSSTLSVTTMKGEKQVWKTRLKINYSKYYKQFYQFPSLRKE